MQMISISNREMRWFSPLLIEGGSLTIIALNIIKDLKLFSFLLALFRLNIITSMLHRSFHPLGSCHLT